MTNNKHQDNPAEEGRHSVVPSVGAGDSIVKVGVPIEQNNGWLKELERGKSESDATSEFHNI